MAATCDIPSSIPPTAVASYATVDLAPLIACRARGGGGSDGQTLECEAEACVGAIRRAVLENGFFCAGVEGSRAATTNCNVEAVTAGAYAAAMEFHALSETDKELSHHGANPWKHGGYFRRGEVIPKCILASPNQHETLPTYEDEFRRDSTVFAFVLFSTIRFWIYSK